MTMKFVQLELLRPGTKVVIDDGRIDAVIIGIQIYPNLTYQCRVEWFHEGSVHDTMLYDFQLKVKPSNCEFVTIGFTQEWE